MIFLMHMIHYLFFDQVFRHLRTQSHIGRRHFHRLDQFFYNVYIPQVNHFHPGFEIVLKIQAYFVHDFREVLNYEIVLMLNHSFRYMK